MAEKIDHDQSSTKPSLSDFLQSIYYDPTVGDTGLTSNPKALRKRALEAGYPEGDKNSKRQSVEQNLDNNVASVGAISLWLSKQEVYTLYKNTTKRFKRGYIPPVRTNYQHESDLIDMTQFSKENDNYKYILLMIDTFSRFVWCLPLKTKKTNEVVKSMKEIFVDQMLTNDKNLDTNDDLPQILRTDKGGEYVSEAMKRLLKDYNIRHMPAQNETKAAIAERAIQTIKLRLLRLMYSKNTKRWVDDLQDVVKGYNNTLHSSLGKKHTPESVLNSDQLHNDDEVLLDQVMVREKKQSLEQRVRKRSSSSTTRKKTKLKPYKFKKNQIVRVSILKNVFTRIYDTHFSTELFRVQSRFRRQGLPMYSLKDWSNDIITGSFYQNELTAATEPEFHKISKVLKRRTLKNGTKQLFVRFLGWSDQYNQWIDADSLSSVKK